MSRATSLLALVVGVSLCSSAGAELPLPDAVFYGRIRFGCLPVESGELKAMVTRGGVNIVEVPGDFGRYDGTPVYAVRVPMESSIGAPGAVRDAARDGDVLESLVLDGETIWSGSETLAWGKLMELTIDIGDCNEIFSRGDANSDGFLDISDPLFTLRHLFGVGDSLACLKAADVDDSGSVNITDPIRTLDFLFQGGPPPAAPYNGCGPDPTDDRLTCLSYPPCAEAGNDAGSQEGGIAGAGGGAAREPAFAWVGGTRKRQDTTDRFLARNSRRGDGRGRDLSRLLVASGALEVTPPTVRIGTIPAGGVERSVVILNRSEREVSLSLRSLSARFVVHPTEIRVPPRGSYAVWVESKNAGEIETGQAAIDISSEGATVARLAIDYYDRVDEAAVALEVGCATVLDGTIEGIALPALLRSSVAIDGLRLRVDYDDDVFSWGAFVSPLKSGRSLPSGTGAIEVELTHAFPAQTDGLVGHVFLVPRTWLAPAVYPVVVGEAHAEVGTTTVRAATTHGEVCSRSAWLDLDGDGRAAASYEAVLARRHFQGEEMLFPEDWPLSPADPVATALRQLLEGRASYLDVDRSGDLEEADFRAITIGLSGLALAERDVAARVRNLTLEEADATVHLNRVRLPDALAKRGLQGGESISIPLLLDLDQPLEELELAIAADPPILAFDRLQPTLRLPGQAELMHESPGTLQILVKAAGGGPAVAPGFGAIGELECRVATREDIESVAVTLSPTSPAVTGSSARIPLATGEPVLKLELCTTGPEDWAVDVSLADGAPDANLLRFALRYPEVIRALDAKGLGQGYDRPTEVHIEESPGVGRAEVLLYQRDGSSLASPGKEVPLARVALSASQPGQPFLRPSLEATVLEASLGPEATLIRSDHLNVGASSVLPCSPAGEDCAALRERFDMGRIFAAFRYLFQDGEEPACYEAHDVDGDGMVELREVLFLVQTSALR